MSADRPVHPSLREVAEQGVELIRDTGANPRRTVPSRPTIKPPRTEEHEEKEGNAA